MKSNAELLTEPYDYVRRFELVAETPGDALILRSIAENFQALDPHGRTPVGSVSNARRIDMLIAAIGDFRPLRPADVARLLDLRPRHVRTRLQKLIQSGRVRRRHDGTYETAMPRFSI